MTVIVRKTPSRQSCKSPSDFFVTSDIYWIPSASACEILEFNCDFSMQAFYSQTVSIAVRARPGRCCRKTTTTMGATRWGRAPTRPAPRSVWMARKGPATPQEASATAARRARGVRDLARGDARYPQGSQGFRNPRTQNFQSREKSVRVTQIFRTSSVPVKTHTSSIT